MLRRRFDRTVRRDGGGRCCRRLCPSALLLMLAASVAMAQTTRPKYRVTDLGDLTERGSTGARINESGQVCGAAPYTGGYWVDPDGTIHGEAWLPLAFRWSDGKMQSLGTLWPDPGFMPRPESAGYGMNDDGWVVGYSCWTGTVRGFVWLPEPAHGLPAGMSALPSFFVGDDEITRAYSINNAGQIVGASATGSSPAPHRAALWEPAAVGWKITSLGTLDNDPTGLSRARDINNLGQIIGLSSNLPVHMRTEPYIWLPTPAYGMPAGMNPLNPGHEDGDVEAINDLGQIVGSPSPAIPVPWLWLPEPAYGLPAGASLLGMFPHPTVEYTHLTSINNRGQIVGYFRYTVDEIYHETRAFIWENGKYTLIDDLLPPDTLWSCHKAYDINDAGQITGTIYADYVYQTLPIGHAVILTPILPGDLNCDGVLTIADVEPFALALVDLPGYAAAYPGCNALAADVDDDGVADGRDVGRFIEMLTGGG